MATPGRNNARRAAAGGRVASRPPVSRRRAGGAAAPQARRARGGTGAIFGDVLCGVDGTRTAYEAVRQAASLAPAGGRLTLLAVVGRHAREQRRNAIEQAAIAPVRAPRTLDYARRIVRDAGLDVEVQVEERSPVARVLLERARDHRLLAVGAPSMSRLGHMLIGGVATAAAHELPVSLLVARRPPSGRAPGGTVLVASDADERSDRLLELAIGLADRRGYRLLLVHAAHAESGFHPTRLNRQTKRVATALGERARVLVAPGRANRVIVETATQERPALIVMGSRRLDGGLRALGSASERVVHDAPCSVLVVRPEDLGR